MMQHESQTTAMQDGIVAETAISTAHMQHSPGFSTGPDGGWGGLWAVQGHSGQGRFAQGAGRGLEGVELGNKCTGQILSLIPLPRPTFSSP